MSCYTVFIGCLSVTIICLLFILYYLHTLPANTEYTLEENIPITTVKEQITLDTTFFQHLRPEEVYPDGIKDRTLVLHRREDGMFLNTTGCQIPETYVTYKKTKPSKTRCCGKRAVFLKKISGDGVKATIKEKIVKTYLRRSALFECCYRFIKHSNRVGEENKKIRYTPCKRFIDGTVIILESDFINVKCFEQRKNTTHQVYDDVYAFTRRISQKPFSSCDNKYNVLLLGIDSMSYTRFTQLMSKTVKFIAENFWLSYEGFHKIGDNTFPNLMAALTGYNISTIAKKCAGEMDKCRDMLIWNKFEESGYVTAYGEDYLRLPDTFSNDYQLRSAPTHHYLRPLFMKGETELFNKSLVCAGKIPSAQHVLNYALDFALTYKQQPFFGVFWMNSYSHNENSRPQDADLMIENFLNRLTYTGVLDNTFIIFFSDHGIRFGKNRISVESYYDERLPFLFIWRPTLFKAKYSLFFDSLVLNQQRLVNPYDLYNTLVDIHSISLCITLTTNSTKVAEGCPQCHSLFNVVSSYRTCQEAAISAKWCSCHKMYPLDKGDYEASQNINLLVSYIVGKSKRTRVKRCWSCMPLSLRNVIRVHFYTDEGKVNLYHVIALTITPGNISYEGVVVRRRGENAELLESVSVISPYRGMGHCTVNPKDRVFCVCQKTSNC